MRRIRKVVLFFYAKKTKLRMNVLVLFLMLRIAIERS